MLSRMTRLPLYFFSAAALLACTGLSPVADAQSLDAQRAQIKAAIDNAERGQADPGQAAALGKHPLYGWVEYATLRRTDRKSTRLNSSHYQPSRMPSSA